MTNGQIALIVFQAILVIAIIIAAFNEEKIAKWEKKFFYNLKRKLTIRRKNKRKGADMS